MNMIQKQADFGRTLFEINQNAMQEMIRTQQENVQKYFEMNTTFGQRLPEVRDVATFVELQREYGATLWSNIKESTQSQASILKAAVEETGEAVRKVFTAESE
jgi:predicted metal-binding protein